MSVESCEKEKANIGSYATNIGLVGLRKKIEKVEEEAVEIVKERLESSEKGVEAIERGEKEIQGEVSFELGSSGGLMQAGVGVGAQVVGGLVATSVVNGILGLRSSYATNIGLVGLRKKIEKVEEEAVEVVKKGLESSEKGVEAIERGEKEIQSEVSFELGSGGGLMQAGVVAGAKVVGGLIATSVVNGILGPRSIWLLNMFLFMSAPQLNTIIVVIGNLELVGQNLKN
nr:homolog of Synechocystis YCF37 [Tanacetum cinerariifolium]